MTVDEEITQLEEEIRKTKYNKHTQFHIGQLKAKLARLKVEQAKKGRGSGGEGYAVKKHGDATVLLVGFPSVGKSTLLNRLTNAESKVGAYDFTTIDVIPGVMEYNGAKIQMFDVPGIIEGVASGKGRGREILSVIRVSDMILIVTDATKRNQEGIIKKELYEAGFRLNQKPPDVVLKKKSGGGIDVGSAVRLTKIDLNLAKSMLQDFKILNADLVIREDINIDQLIDVIMKNRVYIPSVTVYNKTDLLNERELQKLQASSPDVVFISADRAENIEAVRKAVWEGLGLMRIYMKRIGKEPDMKVPMIVHAGSTIRDVAGKVHRQAFGSRIQYARVWGRTAKFPGQKRGPDTVLQDRDIVELHTD